jgi:hypothetical protein
VSGAGTGAAAVSYAAITSIPAPHTAIETATWFDGSHVEPSLSPIDQLIINTNELNLLIATSAAGGHSRQLGALILLGYVSAVESFFRALIRRLVNTDPGSTAAAAGRVVSFGAALHHSRDMLPEALIEMTSFAGANNVAEAFKSFTGVELPKLETNPTPLHPHMRDFQRICELRHCCVHRFGRLGFKNATELGLKAHGRLLEKPLALDGGALGEIAGALRSYAKAVNNTVFVKIMDRTCVHDAHRLDWKWEWRRDRRVFQRYYEIFAATRDGVPPPPPKAVYDSLSAQHAARARARARQA